MKDFIIEIDDKQALRKNHVVFSERDLFESRQEAGRNPITPVIVKRIESKARHRGFGIAADKTELFQIAREILIEGGGIASVVGHSISMEIPTGPKPTVKVNLPLYLIPYNNPLEEIEELRDSIRNAGNIPIVWCMASGLMIDHLSKYYPLFENTDVTGLSDPRELIKFIISKPQKRVAYILEDFHHYIGDQDVVNPSVGEIRSLIKDLYRNLEGRSESVYFFVPSTYELPPELQPFFDQSLKRPKTARGYLDRFGQLLTDTDYILRAKPVIGVDNLIERLVQILAQMEANNPLLVGHPGVGKTAVVEGLAKAIVDGKVPANQRGKMLYSLSLNSLIAGTRYRGDLEARLEGLLEEVLQNKDRIIMFIDEIHTLLDAGSSEGAVGAGDVLKPVLARGEFPCIGATTFDGAEHLAKDPALSRRFKKIIVKEPTIDEAVEILKGVSSCFEEHHRLKIADEALVAAVEVSVKYIPDEYLPGKAISLVDGAAAYCSMRGQGRVSRAEIMAEIERLRKMELGGFAPIGRLE